MAFDGIAARCAAWEIAGIAVGGKVTRIFQPERDEIDLIMRKNADNFRIKISAGSQNSRIGISGVSKENPMNAPVFCMILRKHLTGALLKTVTQVECDRILRLGFETYTEMGDLTEKTLVCEIMGRYSNIVLLNQSGVIIDAIRHVDSRTSSYREVLPARIYAPPPPQNRLLPQDGGALEKFVELMKAPENADLAAGKLLLNGFSGFSKPLSEGILRRAGVESDIKVAHLLENGPLFEAFINSLAEVLECVSENRYSPVIAADENGAFTDFYALEVEAKPGCRVIPFGTVSACMDRFFAGRDEARHRKNVTAELSKAVAAAVERTEKKLKIYREDIESAADSEEYRIKGEILAANLYRLKGGEKFLDAENYFEEDCPEIRIDLDSHLSPAKNLQNYFRTYRRKKSKTENASVNAAAAEADLEYLASVGYAIENCPDAMAAAEIREELENGGFLKKRSASFKKRPPSVKKDGWLALSTRSGMTVLVGRNNTQNDILTHKIAAPDDIWFHVKNSPGSHVILRASENAGKVTAADVEEAAKTAAKFSSLKDAGFAEVDYTRVKHVKKPHGSKPGKAVYVNYKTVAVRNYAGSDE
ncbi:MAG: NFACT family protein [Clostridia bacterium]|nr:NFACT family protein [Clostridia bacterium]